MKQIYKEITIETPNKAFLLLQELGRDLMQTPFGVLPERHQQEVLWHLQANDFPGAKRVRDKYERQQRLKGNSGLSFVQLSNNSQQMGA